MNNLRLNFQGWSRFARNNGCMKLAKIAFESLSRSPREANFLPKLLRDKSRKAIRRRFDETPFPRQRGPK